MIGIYKITNKINGKCYIGQSNNIERRWNDHKIPSSWNDPNKSSYNYPLYAAFRKYKLENFIFEVIEECNQEELNDKEIYWIQYYNSYYDGYNQTIGGVGTPINDKPVYQYDLFGRYIAEYANMNIAASKTNTNYHSLNSCLTHYNNQYYTNGYQWSYIKTDYIGPSPMYTPVICFDLSGKRLAEYYCINEAVKATGCCAEIIKQSCQDHQIHNSTYQWRYWEEDPELQIISPSMPYTDKKQIKQYDLNGNLIKIWNSISEAANTLNIERTNIIGVCKKRTKSAGGFIWQYIEDNSLVKYEKNYNTKHIFKTRAVLQYDLNDNFIAEYPSIKEACAAINKNKIYTSVSHISSCCRGRQKTAYGFKWKYKENNNE